MKYLVFGGMTTLINYGVFLIAISALGVSAALYANVLAFVLATVFAFVTNKHFVFESADWGWRTLWKEGSAFVAARLISFLFEQMGLYLSIRFLPVGEFGVMVMKVVLSAIVVLLNYVFSKCFIFRGK